ncbi:UTRA domain-containing protein [Streptomyces virginiae]|uniref:UTRA domain-containing protein n=1 Tax=Streptomyces virginiae TaxID=1961 RepID=UPI00224ECCD1|nr:UTRA domain-containing protein [Streptomyces virginiae]
MLDLPSRPPHRRKPPDVRRVVRSRVVHPRSDRGPPDGAQHPQTHQRLASGRRPRRALTSRSGFMTGQDVSGRSFRPLRRRGIQRLAQEQWGSGRSVWSTDTEDRELVVDQIEVREEDANGRVCDVLGVAAGTRVWARSRRFVLDGKPVLFAMSYLPSDVVADSAITQVDTGPGGAYARLAELGHAPVHFREEIRSRMPSADEAERLSLSMGTPVIHIVRTAFAEGGRVVEVNEMTLDSASYVLEYDFDA